MSAHAPVGGKLLTKPFMVLLILAGIAFAILAQRFIFGLGEVTNLNNEYPWGIWIVIDVMIGTAFGCAGYAIALVVYLLNRGEYHPLVRPAIMAGMFGYALGGFAVVIDLGRYWQFYTLLLPWYVQFNSVMLEVALCVMAYIVVLFIEFSPAFLERLGMKDVRKKLSKVLFIFIAIGILLPTMHQSSLGTLATVFGHQISPLWQTQLLPALFLISALLMGYAIVPFEGVLAALGFHQPMETSLFGKLSRFIFIVLAAYVVLRVVDLSVRGAWGYAFAGTLDALMFWVEMALFIMPLVVLASAKNRTNIRWIFVSAISLLLAGSIYRINTYLVGYHPAEGWHYFPSVSEIMVTVGIFSLEVVLYLIFVKTLPVLHKAHA
ncbi:MAG: Ni/Fe-hydrogenase cytochrome b subunit [Gammaproteobacteria bacterium]|jgi:Ni/Fe-hydrogenase subunit HybB-like protein|nr:Ni/Fe-hydrogenase cytochrome b subunit [Gammaproteobacteria bacterium]